MMFPLVCVFVVLTQISFVIGKNELILTSIKETEISNPTMRFDKLELHKVNKKEAVLGGSFTFSEDIPANATLQVDTYKKTKNGYTLSAAGSLKNLHFCSFYKDDKIAAPDIIEKTDLTDACPFKKGTYQVHELKINADRASDNLPEGQHRSDLIFSDEDGKRIGYLTVFYEIK